jgi:hypothetical protein
LDHAAAHRARPQWGLPAIPWLYLHPTLPSWHEAGLLSYFAHRITNAGAESLNSRIQAIRVSARGYRNRENFKTAIYFHCGGLQLYPATVSH